MVTKINEFRWSKCFGHTIGSDIMRANVNRHDDASLIQPTEKMMVLSNVSRQPRNRWGCSEVDRSLTVHVKFSWGKLRVT